MSNGKGAIVFLAIIAIASLGLSGYLLIDKVYLSPADGATMDKGGILVGLWENLKKTPNDSFPDISWYITLDEREYINENYIGVPANNSQFTLKAIGVYKIVLTTLLYDCDPESNHWIELQRNGFSEHYVERTSISANPEDSYWYVSSTFYVNNTSQEILRFYCYSSFDSNGFYIYSTSNWNQLAIEYLK